jgi:hypothetical protein
MVEDRLRDGRRIAQLLASEVTGDADRLPGVAVADADRDVEPTVDGAFAYSVAREPQDDEPLSATGALGWTGRLAEVYVHPDRVRIELLAGQAAAAERADTEGLRVRPKAAEPPRTLVFVPDGAAVKPTTRVLAAALEAAAVDAEE